MLEAASLHHSKNSK